MSATKTKIKWVKGYRKYIFEGYEILGMDSWQARGKIDGWTVFLNGKRLEYKHYLSDAKEFVVDHIAKAGSNS